MLSKLLSKHKSMIDDCIDLEDMVRLSVNVIVNHYKPCDLDSIDGVDWYWSELVSYRYHRLDEQLIQSAMARYYEDNKSNLVNSAIELYCMNHPEDTFAEEDVNRIESLSSGYIQWLSGELGNGHIPLLNDIYKELAELGLVIDDGME